MSTEPIKKPALSVVVLCYKSGERLIPFLAKMEEEFRDEKMDSYELVLVGNYHPGSGDRTPDIIRDLAGKNPRVVPVTLEKKGMFGWDARTGFAAATGDSIALIDGDGKILSADIVRLWRVLKSGEFDLVKTFRKARLDGGYRKFISACFNVLFRLLFPNTTFRDINSKPKIMTRKAYQEMRLSSDDWFLDAEIMLEAYRLDLNVAEVPTVFNKNEWRGSFVKPWTNVEFIINLLKYRIKYWFQ